jgi:hypothetical protein
MWINRRLVKRAFGPKVDDAAEREKQATGDSVYGPH